MKKKFGVLLVSAMFGSASASPSAPIAGTDYEVMTSPVPVSAPAGKIEVIEFFWYGCRHCHALESAIKPWKAKYAGTIEFKRIPVAFHPSYAAHSQLFYTLSALGVSDKIDSAVFDAILTRRNYLLSPQAQADFVATQGVDKSKFLNVYHSFSVQAQVGQSAALPKRYAIDGVPTLVIQGKYKTGPAYTKSIEGAISVADYLVRQVRDKKL
ncbi:thiol:disulfide interchange protein DsbA/DsbL [Burkholderia sp. BCC0044]|uniref:thiol:disulfide interchange protein DsbA/DsbL n=1 Tax=Burkholderia sp. BCC0044 TaxID=2676295 RepID=UPI00158A5E93|nr:thiol:disulfide interchange protein DsbA/DsbL [Burkholderia sp. BCC0044]